MPRFADAVEAGRPRLRRPAQRHHPPAWATRSRRARRRRRPACRPCPAATGVVERRRRAANVVEAIGFPVMIKAAAGGGGRGIRVARDLAEFERLMPQASAEAQGRLRRRRPLYREAGRAGPPYRGPGPRRRRQPRPSLRARMLAAAAPAEGLGGGALRRSSTPDRREAICASAVALAKSVGYRGAGTLEYLYDDATGDFFFIEMNTRIQVEHPVTEMVTGHRLLREMLHHRRRRAAAPPPGRHRRSAATRSRCASMPRIRRTASCRIRAPSAICTRPAGRASVSIRCSIPATPSRPSTIRCSAS